VLAALAFVVAAVIGAGTAQQPPRALDSSAPIPYFVADGRGKTGFRPADPELARWAFEAWQRSAGGSLTFEPSPEAAALVRIYWADPTGGQYGETAAFLVSGKRGAAVFVRPDTDALGVEIARRARTDALLRDAIVYLTCLHELGHALGLAHTNDFRDVMYYFGFGGDITEYFGRYRADLRTRADIAKVSGLSKNDIARIRALY
jgi:hypothetical protein